MPLNKDFSMRDVKILQNNGTLTITTFKNKKKILNKNTLKREDRVVLVKEVFSNQDKNKNRFLLKSSNN